MNRYRSELLGNIRHARTQLITGLENPRISPVTKERMMSWISEAEDELIARLNDATPSSKDSAKRVPMIWEMQDGIREPQDAHDRERLAWSYQG